MSERDVSVCEHFQRAAETLGRRWNPQIVRVLLGGPRRFGEIRDAIPGISDHLLSGRLKQLEAEGIVRRDVVEDRPVLIEYRLTQAGEDLGDAIRALSSWAERWSRREGEARHRSPAGGRSR